MTNQRCIDPRPRPAQRLMRRRSAIRSRRGTYTVEFALCAAVLFMTLFAMFEFSRFLFVRQATEQAAYEAARVGIVPGATREDIQERAEMLLSVAGVRNAQIAITPEVITDTTTEVSVEIRMNFGENSWLPTKFISRGDFVTRTVLDHENQAFIIPKDAAENAALTTNDEPLDV